MAKLKYTSPVGAKVGLIFPHPDRLDIVDGQPLSTRSGRFLKHALHDVGIKPSDCFIDYIYTGYPGRSGFDSMLVQDEVKEYAPKLKRHIADSGVKILLLFGPQVLPYFGILDGLKKTRGFVFDAQSPYILPTFAPYSLFSGNGEQEVTFMNDLDKAANIALHGYSRPPEDFLLAPTVDQVKEFLTPIYKEQRKIYVDIEAIGSLNERDHNDITMIGIGDAQTKKVMVVPFLVKGGLPHYSVHDEKTVRLLIRKVLQRCPSVFHNAEYDAKHLNYQGFGPVRIGGDTMLLHHALHPELPHSLDYVTSVYGTLPYWKDTLKKAKHQLDIDNKKLWTYNARDVVATMQIEPELEAECKEQNTYSVYEDISIPMLDVVLEMNNNGVPIDGQRLITWRQQLADRNETILDGLSNLWAIHPAFNWDSPQHMRWLLYGEAPSALSQREAEYAEYFLADCKKKKTTKKFKTLEDYIGVFRDTVPFRTLGGLSVKRTKTGSSVDDEMRKRIQEAIIKRTEKLINMIRKTEGHFEEEADLGAMRQIIDNLMEYAENGKLLSTYTKLHIEPDGKVHPGYKVAGTKTGRLSSYSPNGQNLPPAAKRVFVARPGWKFIQFDYTNLELVVLAYFANIPYLIDVFERGLNVHDENTKRFLGIDKSNKKWEEWRRVMKTYVFGRNYGGSLRGMYRRMLTEIPGLQMTFKQFEELDKNYFKLMPEYREWYDATIDLVRRTRTLYNAFGRNRIFLGPIDKVERESLNFPIQSTAADIMAFGLIDFYKEYCVAKEKGLEMQLCMSVHDSAVLHAPEREILVVLKMLKRHMCKARQIGDYEVSFNGEVKIMDDLKGKKEDEKTINAWIDEYELRKKAKRASG